MTTPAAVFNSPLASQFRKAAFTDEEMKLASQLSRLNVPYRMQVEFSTGKSIARNGLILCYTVDFKVGEKLIVEIVGDGSSSDDPERHEFFTKTLGMKVLYISNRSVNASPSLVAHYIQDEYLLSLIRESGNQ